MLGELDHVAIDELLRNALVARLGVVHRRRCHVVPITYVYDGTAIYGQSAEGLKLRMLRQSPRDVCVEIEQIDDMTNWRTVIAWGDFEELAGAAAERARRLLVDRLRPLDVSETTQLGRVPDRARPAAPPVVFRIVLHERSGRCEAR